MDVLTWEGEKDALHIEQPEHRLFVVEAGSLIELHVQDYLGGNAVPLGPLTGPEALGGVNAPAMVILPIEGGGRGAVVNNGQTIDLTLLLSLLADAIGESQLTAALNTRLDAIPDLRRNDRNQSGYGKPTNQIVLDDPWADRVPTIEVVPASGRTVVTSQTQVGVDPDCVTYFDLLDHEIIFGHSGVHSGNRFYLNGAILSYAAPTEGIPILYDSTSAIGPPSLSVITDESPLFNTVADCMGIRAQGILSLQSTASPKVKGTIHLQVSVDAGDWVTMAQFYGAFDADDNGIRNRSYDEMLVFPQGPHSYKFRGLLIVESGEDETRRLTASVGVTMVDESGSGSIISNDIRLRWSAKE